MDSRFLRDRALKLAEKYEPRGDRSELDWALSELSVSVDSKSFQQISAMLAFIAKTLFRDVSKPVPQRVRRKILEFDGPRFFFVGHTSYFDYVLTSQLISRIGMPAPIMHVTGSLTKGWVSNWLKGFRTLTIPKSIVTGAASSVRLVFCCIGRERRDSGAFYSNQQIYGALARRHPPGALRSTRCCAGVKATDRAMIVPVSISYEAVPETPT